MLRLSPPGHARLTQTPTLEMRFGGAELNVLASLAQWGMSVAFVSKLPDNDVAQACLNEARGLGVDISGVRRGGGRMGIFFVETGAAQRGSTVTYDRAGSSLSQSSPGEWDWEALLAGADVLHVSGITPALGDGCRAALRAAMEEARRQNVLTVFDVNYRSKLWRPEVAGGVIAELLPLADLALVGMHDAELLFGITPTGETRTEQQKSVAWQLGKRFGLPSGVGMTARESFSASRNDFSALFYVAGNAYSSRTYTVDPIVDRVGTGDAFAAGLIYGFLNEMTPQESIEFAAASGCLKHSIPGDYNRVSADAVRALAAGDSAGRIER